MQATDAKLALLAILFIAAAVVLSEITYRYKRRKRVAYNDFLLHRRDNFPLGDLDVDRSE